MPFIGTISHQNTTNIWDPSEVSFFNLPSITKSQLCSRHWEIQKWKKNKPKNPVVPVLRKLIALIWDFKSHNSIIVDSMNGAWVALNDESVSTKHKNLRTKQFNRERIIVFSINRARTIGSPYASEWSWTHTLLYAKMNSKWS